MELVPLLLERIQFKVAMEMVGSNKQTTPFLITCTLHNISALGNRNVVPTIHNSYFICYVDTDQTKIKIHVVEAYKTNHHYFHNINTLELYPSIPLINDLRVPYPF